mmetsp:Transcript_4389/g.7778  ORF Transcript_4389/g.7778 Transcript_4389/m.7778 type:complete len:92 (+) Transcript_4389:2059-2334(+)
MTRWQPPPSLHWFMTRHRPPPLRRGIKTLELRLVYYTIEVDQIVLDNVSLLASAAGTVAIAPSFTGAAVVAGGAESDGFVAVGHVVGDCYL